MKRRAHSHTKSPADLASLTSQLREKALKMTGPRAAILRALSAQKHPLTIKEILALLPKKDDCDLATIYRSVHLLESMRMVARYDFGDGSARFELLREEVDHHHHHLICTRCSAVVEIEDCFPRELEQKIATGHGFVEISHKLEFFGVCGPCKGRKE